MRCGAVVSNEKSHGVGVCGETTATCAAPYENRAP